MNQGIFLIVLSFFLIISKNGSLEPWSKSILCKDGLLSNPGASCHPSHTSWATLFLSPLSYLHATDNRIEKNISIHLGFPGGSAGKESTCNAGDLGLIPGWGRSPGEENGYPLQYSGLENFMNCIGVHGVAKSQTQLSGFHFHFHFHLPTCNIWWVRWPRLSPMWPHFINN